MWNFIKLFFGKLFFGIGGTEEVLTSPVAPPPAPKPKAQYSRSNVSARKYYKRNGNYYSRDDDCIIEDAILLVILMDMFDNNEIHEFQEGSSTDDNIVEEDLLDMDVSDMEVVASTHKTRAEEVAAAIESYSEPERVSSYSSDSSDSSYDSGSSDSGGSDD